MTHPEPAPDAADGSGARETTGASSPPIEPSPPSAGGRTQEFATAGRNAIKLAASLTISWTVAFFVRFPLPRDLGPARYGIFNFADNFAATFFSLIDLGVSTYIFREIPVRPRHASEFWGGLLVVRIAASLLLFAVMAITLAVSHHSLEVQETVLVFGLAQFVTTYTTSVGALLHAVTRVDRVAIANVAAKCAWGLGLLAALKFWSWSLPLVALPLFISESLKLLVIYPEAHKSLDLKLRVDRAVTKTVLLASLPFFISTGAINIGGRLNVAVLEFVIHDEREVGWFGAAQNLASLTMLLSPLFSWVLMPLLARAKARSEEEVYKILRRTIEGLLITVIPMTLIASLGAAFWVHLAFKAAFDPAALSLRLLAFGFILIYLAIALSTLLIMTGHSWSVSMISLGSVPMRPILVTLLAPPCARHFGPGGGALGAALAEIITSMGIVAAHFIPIGGRALDRRLLVAGGKSLAVAAAVTVLDHTVLARLGAPLRLLLDCVLYVVLALASRTVQISEIRSLVQGLRASRAAKA
ncbi:MAG TPA: oligosaccharide flippase family protein [Polyangiaceae bacterium]